MSRRALPLAAALLGLVALALAGAAVATAVGPAAEAQAEPATTDPIICPELPCIPPPPTTTGTTSTIPPPPPGTTSTTTTSGSTDTDGDGIPDYVYSTDLGGDGDADAGDRDLYSSATCRAAWGGVQLWSAGRLVKQFDYRLTFRYCYRGGKVTAIRDMVAFSKSAIWPWQFKGNIVGPQPRNLGSYAADVFVQGRYEVCLFSGGCTFSKTPWMNVTVFASGTIKPVIRFGWG